MRALTTRTVPGAAPAGGCAAAVAAHVVHFAVKAGVEPPQQVPLVLRDLDARDAECVEAQGAGARWNWPFSAARSMAGSWVMA